MRKTGQGKRVAPLFCDFLLPKVINTIYVHTPQGAVICCSKEYFPILKKKLGGDKC